MAILNKLMALLGVEPGYDVSTLKKSARLMEEDLYWQIVDRSLKGIKNQFDQEEFLIKELKRFTPEEIVGFKLRTQQLLHNLYSLKTIGAAYILTAYEDHVGFTIFGSWVISKGRKVYYNAVQDPETLVAFELGEDLFEFDAFTEIPNIAFQEKTGREIDKWIAHDQVAVQESSYPYIVHNLYSEETTVLRSMCPKLFDKFWDA